MDEILSSEGTRTKRLLLHCCCAPCSSHCLTVLAGKIGITAYYYNPNITDRAEHDKRAEELKRLVGILNSEYPEASIVYEKVFFEPELFLEASKGLEKEKVLRIPVFDEYFAKAMNRNYDNIGKRHVDYTVFNAFLRKCLEVK